METVSFSDSKGNKLLGIVSIPKQAKSIVIMSHGFTSSKDGKLYLELESELNKNGIGTFRYDYYGHGPLYCKDSAYGVSKDVTISKCVDSLKAALELVRSKGTSEIGLIGSSFGGLISLIIASQDSKIKALALKSPVTEPVEFWKERLGNQRIEKWKKEGIMHYDERSEKFELNYGFWEDLITFDTFKMAKHITCPILIVHGDKDFVVPIKQSQDFAKVVKTKVRIVKGANHVYSDPLHYKEMKKLR